MSQRRKAHRRFRELVPESEPLLRRLARTFAEGDQDLADDLLQEGLIAVYMMTPAELRAAEDPVEACVGRAVRMMFRYRKRQRHQPHIGVASQDITWRKARQLRYLTSAEHEGEDGS